MLIQELEDINMIVLGIFFSPTSRQAGGSSLEMPEALPGSHRSAFRATLPRKERKPSSVVQLGEAVIKGLWLAYKLSANRASRSILAVGQGRYTATGAGIWGWGSYPWRSRSSIV